METSADKSDSRESISQASGPNFINNGYWHALLKLPREPGHQSREKVWVGRESELK